MTDEKEWKKYKEYYRRSKMRVNIKIKRIHPDAVIPEYQKEGDAGFDFVAVKEILIRGGMTRVVPTGLQVAIPKGYEIEVVPRSGLSRDTPLVIANSPGTIDSGYRGEIGVIAYNKADYSTTVPKGLRIAQGKVKKVPRAEFKEVDELPKSDRGGGGFGHTGKKYNKEEE